MNQEQLNSIKAILKKRSVDCITIDITTAKSC